MGDVFGALNNEQREAAFALGNCLTSACPGSGKTRMLAAKAVHLLSDARSSLMAVTFTRDAALEIRSRIADLAGSDAKSRLLVGTFHSLAYFQPRAAKAKEGYGAAIFARMRRDDNASRQKTNIATEGDRIAYLMRAMEIAELGELDPEEALRLLESVKGQLTQPSEQKTPGARLFHAYQDVLRRNGKVDFQDLVLSAVRGMKNGTLAPYPVQYMLVDEFQDTDALQYEWILSHAKAGTRITAVGDDDQSIYGWRQAMGYAGMERFAKDCGAHRVVLGLNYRSRAEILSVADTLIRKNLGRLPKELRPARGSGGSVQFVQAQDSADEGCCAADWCADMRAQGHKDIAVLSRTNRRLDYTEGALAVRGVPYVRTGGRSLFDRPEVSVFADILNLAVGAGDTGLDHALTWAGVPEEDLRVLHQTLGKRLIAARRAELAELPLDHKSVDAWWEFGRRLEAWRSLAKRGGKEALVLEGIASWMCDRVEKDRQADTVRLATAAFSSVDAPLDRRVTELRNRRRKLLEATDAVTLATMHGAKGREWERVWIVSAEEKVIPDEKAAVEEERRLMYVAMTRAKEALVLSASTKQPASRFIWEAGIELESQQAQAA